ncbi:MAG: hypothetical protein AAF560_20480 [Acidobacteriota bacterium]
MTRPDPEEILWKLSAVDRDREDAPLPSDTTLIAYREGRLDETESRRVEALLGHSAEARDRLIELAGEPLPGPSPALRERLLPPEPRRASGPSFVRSFSSSFSRRWAAPLAMAAGLVLAVGLYLAQPRTPSELPRYDVTVEMLSTVRSAEPAEPDGPDVVYRAYPDTSVRIVMEPSEHGAADVELGLYVRRDRQLERLSPGAGLSVTTHRGTAVFEAPASRLVGTVPGSYELFAVAASRLPETLPLAAGESAAASLEIATDGHVYPCGLTLLARPAGSSR